MTMDKLKLSVLALAATALFGAGALAGCGDDDDDDEAATEETAAEETAAGPTEVTLVADDAGGNYTFELSETPTAETKSIVFDNQGAEPHALIYARLGEGYTVDEAYELEGRKGSATILTEGGAPPGKTQTLPVKGAVEPGDYAMLCPIGSPDGVHYELGQLEEFTIE
jgi:hypothetical protein